MVDLPISGSGMAWLFVVLVQAIIHFCFIGPRNKRRRKFKEQPFLDKTSPAGVEEQVLVLATNSGSTNLKNEIPCLGDHDVLSTFLYSTDPTPPSDHDECDSRPTESALPLNEAESRGSLSPHGCHKFFCSPSHSSALPLSSLGSDSVDDDGSEASMSQSSRDEDECPRIPSTAHDYSDQLEYDDYDADSYFEDEDDQWRYKLAQDYYSHGSPSIVKMARTSHRWFGTEEDDPALEPMKNTGYKTCLPTEAKQVLLASKGVLLTLPVNFSRTDDDIQDVGGNNRSKQILVASTTPVQCA